MRIDKLLWFLRLARTRGLAQTMTESGHLRLNGRRVERAHLKVSPGDVLVLMRGESVIAIEVLSLPSRRGPAPEAQACYRVLDDMPGLPLAAAPPTTAAEGDLQP